MKLSRSERYEPENIATINPFPLNAADIAGKPYDQLSYYERGALFCTTVTVQAQVVELASQVQPPNLSLITAISAAADKSAFEDAYRIGELSASTGWLGYISRRREITRLQARSDAYRELSAFAIAELEARR